MPQIRIKLAYDDINRIMSVVYDIMLKSNRMKYKSFLNLLIIYAPLILLRCS